jgi:hypothetical protein
MELILSPTNMQEMNMNAILDFLFNHWFAVSLIPILWPLIVGPKNPADESNRLNQFILLWFAITRTNRFSMYQQGVPRFKVIVLAWYKPHLFVSDFLWLRNDMWDNMKQVTRVIK